MKAFLYSRLNFNAIGVFMITTWLPTENIQIVDSVCDWKQAITLAAQPLLDKESITQAYIKAILNNHQELGPCYILAPGLAMPHARPEDGVNRLGLGLTVIKQGVNFDSEGNDPIRLLITLAASDSNSHVETIAQLAELFMNEEDVAAIIAADTKDDILRILARY